MIYFNTTTSAGLQCFILLVVGNNFSPESSRSEGQHIADIWYWVLIIIFAWKYLGILNQEWVQQVWCYQGSCIGWWGWLCMDFDDHRAQPMCAYGDDAYKCITILCAWTKIYSNAHGDTARDSLCIWSSFYEVTVCFTFTCIIVCGFHVKLHPITCALYVECT